MSNNLIGTLHDRTVSIIRSVINDVKNQEIKSETITFSLDDVGCALKKLNLPKGNIRNLDEPYVPDPVRYIITGPEHVPYLKRDHEHREGDYELFTFKSHGYIENYEIFSDLLFPTDLLIVIEDDGNQMKLLRKFKLNFKY